MKTNLAICYQMGRKLKPHQFAPKSLESFVYEAGRVQDVRNFEQLESAWLENPQYVPPVYKE